MKKTIIILCLILSGLLILDSFHVGQAIVMFLLAGEIPGTSSSISAAVLLEVYLIAAGFICARLVVFAVRRAAATFTRHQLV